MICPLKFASVDEPFCDKEKCGFYAGDKCAVAAIPHAANEFMELKATLNRIAETLDGTNQRLAFLSASISTAKIYLRKNRSES